ncbi:hypothetical protein F5887DRAFT_1074742 [Amanita rubescens]|nr:hypothetical protein F5887DRAFT_1074742 [Amanita rubescens]
MTHNPDSRTLSLLRAILEDLKNQQPQSTRISNAGTINTMRELLSQRDYIKIAAHINNASDAEHLLDFILPLLRNESHSNGELKES